MKDAQTIGEYTKTKRTQAGITLGELSRLAGVHKSFISRLESGERHKAAPEVLERIANVLKLDPSELLSFIGVTPQPLPPVRTYFRRAYGVSEEGADVLAQLIEDYQQRKEGEHDENNKGHNKAD
ncbi:helix-turn-helix transcriptional regulator [Amycolatopsis sp. NBC_01307]|uniref:helix-turn-helix domain-containing protein n=1 Tax=Amycolatopsis sp. NBC_01307 TaxID=2903561 RepID=UPI002E16879D|nr:helix-turn-helix transcriptional regulator [Amycolatopsis sp. NBC_01307]